MNAIDITFGLYLGIFVVVAIALIYSTNRGE